MDGKYFLQKLNFKQSGNSDYTDITYVVCVLLCDWINFF